eukprot:6213171-Pleurochrysis_carterae.AAC.4
MDVELLVYPQRINNPNERTEGENFHFTAGTHINSDDGGEREDPQYGLICKSAIVRKGSASDGVNIAPAQQRHRTPHVSCTFCNKEFRGTHVRIEARLGDITPCTGRGKDFDELKEKLEDEYAKSMACKARKRALHELDVDSQQPS